MRNNTIDMLYNLLNDTLLKGKLTGNDYFNAVDKLYRIINYEITGEGMDELKK